MAELLAQHFPFKDYSRSEHPRGWRHVILEQKMRKGEKLWCFFWDKDNNHRYQVLLQERVIDQVDFGQLPLGKGLVLFFENDRIDRVKLVQKH